MEKLHFLGEIVATNINKNGERMLQKAQKKKILGRYMQWGDCARLWPRFKTVQELECSKIKKTLKPIWQAVCGA